MPSPFAYRGGIGFTQASYVYDTLMWKDLDGQEIPWLATEHEGSQDGREHIYTLRKTTWSDGTAFTSADVVFTFTYLEKHRKSIAPSVISVPPMGLVESVEAMDEHRVRFRLSRPDWTFPRFTGAGGVFIIPRHIWSDIAEPAKVDSKDTLIGTGPYRLTQMDATASAYRYEARDDFFLGAPLIKTIEHRPVSDPLVALKVGEVDQAGGVGPGTGLRPQAVEPFKQDDSFEVIEAPVGQTTTALYFNLKAGGALADVAFRQACAQAINRQALVEKALGGGGQVGNPGLIPPGHRMHTEVEQYGFDRAAAEKALDAAGYRRPDAGGTRVDGTTGKPLSFELLISEAQPKDIVDLVVADLVAVGIAVTPATVDLATFGRRRMADETQLSVNTFGGVATDEQPDGMSKVYHSQSRSLQSAQGYANEEFDRLVMRQRQELDEKDRIATAAEMQQIVARDLPILPLVYPPLVTICRKAALPTWSDTPGGVGGLVPSVNNKVAFIGKARS